MNQTLQSIATFISSMFASPKRLFIGIGVGLGALLAFAVAASIVMFIARTLFGGMPSIFGARDMGYMQGVGNSVRGGYGAGEMYSTAAMTEEVASYDSYSGLSAKMAPSVGMPASIMPPSYPILPPMPTVNGGRNAEKFERTGYSAHYETRRLEKVCGAVEALKPMEYVLFDSAHMGTQNCNYVFRVESSKKDEVVTKLQDLNPKEWSVSVDTMAQQIEDVGDRTKSLERRLASIEQTLKESEAAYARLTATATQSGKVSDLTEIITQRLAMSERLTNEKINLEEQIRQMTNTKTDQVDETAYAHFTVSVAKLEFVNWQNIGAAWRNNFSHMLYRVNDALTSIAFDLPYLIVQIVLYALFIGISLLAAVGFVKYMWVWVMKIWRM